MNEPKILTQERVVEMMASEDSLRRSEYLEELGEAYFLLLDKIAPFDKAAKLLAQAFVNWQENDQ